ncbi:hypothetical protein GCM10010253_38900 [Streptomyces badius]|uniref:Uncharacterized protein n=1 Tax=Streptomyces badius TaxID=1941 RepID=A0ABQ2TCQ7_STRBA|nr:hypothetical protein GCM10010253_38900 [Streptomyces badius]
MPWPRGGTASVELVYALALPDEPGLLPGPAAVRTALEPHTARRSPPSTRSTGRSTKPRTPSPAWAAEVNTMTYRCSAVVAPMARSPGGLRRASAEPTALQGPVLKRATRQPVEIGGAFSILTLSWPDAG